MLLLLLLWAVLDMVLLSRLLPGPAKVRRNMTVPPAVGAECLSEPKEVRNAQPKTLGCPNAVPARTA